MGYISSLKSTENGTQAVMRLPKPLTYSFHKKQKNFEEEHINLIKFEI